jgi:small nuclear ribonucleoprotein (snRNP)-like protein
LAWGVFSRPSTTSSPHINHTHARARTTSRPPPTPRSAGTLHTTLFDWLAEAAGGSGQAVDNPSASPPSPLAALHALYRDRARVCVTVADGAGAGDGSVRMPHVRRIVGTLRGFDEAWTLVLLDAEEEEEEEWEEEGGKGEGGSSTAATRARHSQRKHAQLLVMGDTVVSVGRRVS